MKKLIALAFLFSVLVLSGCPQQDNGGNGGNLDGLDGGNGSTPPEPPVFAGAELGLDCAPYYEEPVGGVAAVEINVPENVPRDINWTIEDGLATPCIDNELAERIEAGDYVVCQACGWGCASREPRFWRWESDYAKISIYVWNVPCEGLGLEYRYDGLGEKEGIKVLVS